MSDMLDLDVPALRGGKPIIVESEPDWYVKQVMEEFVVRAERIRGGGVDPSVDNFLKITHEARLLPSIMQMLLRQEKHRRQSRKRQGRSCQKSEKIKPDKFRGVGVKSCVLFICFNSRQKMAKI